jgi:hypothetical protein
MGITFNTSLLKAEGKNATGIQVPDEVMVSLGVGKKPSVTVNLNGYTYPSTIAVMGGKFLIPFSSAHREASGLSAGDTIEVTLELDLEVRTVEVPDDLMKALSAHVGKIAVFEALAYSKRKELVRQVNDAKTQETRDRRIAGIVTNLSVLRMGVFIAAGLLVLIITGVIVLNISKSNTPSNAITIPKIKLPKSSNSEADRVGLIVYKGLTYTQTGTHINPDVAEKLLGTKIGHTKAGIDEWSKQEDYTELASTIGGVDVYTVNGYDSDFRIMSYQKQEEQIYAGFYEQLNGIAITKGIDLIGKTNLLGNVALVKWQTFDNWNHNKPQFEELQVDGSLQAFIEALYEAKPIAAEPLQRDGIYDKGDHNQKFLFLKLKDQTEVQLTLFKGNYVKYGGASVFFEVDPVAFSTVWDKME